MWFTIAAAAGLGGTWLIVTATDNAGFWGGVVFGGLGLLALRRGFKS